MTRIFSKSCLRFQVPCVTSTLERQSTSMYILLSHMKSSSQEREKGKTQVKTESITKLNNFTFQWTKALYQNNLKHIAFFFTFFEGYKCNKLYEIIKKKNGFYGSSRNQASKASNFTKWNPTHDNFTCVFSISVKFDIYFLGLQSKIVFGGYYR